MQNPILSVQDAHHPRLANEKTPTKQLNGLMKLPVELVEVVLHFLDLSDIWRMQLVSKSFYELMDRTCQRMHFTKPLDETVLIYSVLTRFRLAEITMVGQKKEMENVLSSLSLQSAECLEIACFRECKLAWKDIALVMNSCGNLKSLTCQEVEWIECHEEIPVIFHECEFEYLEFSNREIHVETPELKKILNQIEYRHLKMVGFPNFPSSICQSLEKIELESLILNQQNLDWLAACNVVEIVCCSVMFRGKVTYPNSHPNFSSLQTLECKDCLYQGICEAILSMIGRKNALRKLSACHLSSPCIPFEAIQLEHLDVHYFEKSTLMFIQRHPNALKSLMVTNPVNIEILNQIGKCNKIEILGLGISMSISIALHALFTSGSIYKSLHDLSLAESDELDNQFPKQLKIKRSFPKVQDLKLKTKYFDAKFLLHFPKVKRFQLVCQNSDGLFPQIASHSSLQELNVDFEAVINDLSFRNGHYVIKKPQRKMHKIHLYDTPTFIAVTDFLRLMVLFPNANIFLHRSQANSKPTEIRYPVDLLQKFARGKFQSDLVAIFKTLIAYQIKQILSKQWPKDLSKPDYLKNLKSRFARWEPNQTIDQSMSELWKNYQHQFLPILPPSLPLNSPPRQLVIQLAQQRYLMLQRKIDLTEERIIARIQSSLLNK